MKQVIFSLMAWAAGFSGSLSAEEPTRLTQDGSFKQHLQWSPDGKSFSMTRIHQGKMAIWLMDADGRNLRRLLLKQDTPHFDAHWSPDSRQLAFVFDILQGTDGKLQIDVANVDGSEQQNRIPHKAFEESPRWSPDGKRLLWVSTRDGNPELYLFELETKAITRLTSEVAFDLHPAWSPDGKEIAFSSSRSGRQKIYLMNNDGKNLRRLTEGEGIDSWPVWSPDGRSLAYVSHQDGNYEVYTIDRDGKNRVNRSRSPAMETSPCWSPDGKRLAFLSTRHGGTDVYVMTLNAK